MHIYSKGIPPVRPGTPGVQPASGAEQDTVAHVAPAQTATDRTDRVVISDAGRALAAREDKVPETVARASEAGQATDAERSARVRGRILSGAYDTLEVVDAVARRILASGDL